jgi:hypothetical protein
MRLAWLVLLLVLPRTVDAQSSRVAVPLPIPATALAEALHVSAARPSTILLDAIRLAYASSDVQARQRAEAALERVVSPSTPATGEMAPLPLDPGVWRRAILVAPVPDNRLVAAILRDRAAALMYLGLSALDDPTLTWIASRPDTLRLLRAHPASFAAFGRSVRVRGTALDVPGGAEAVPLWRDTVDVDPALPADFIARLFGGDGRVAFLYDTIAHLDAPHQRFALALYLTPAPRQERLRSLMRAFAAASPEWRADERPFARPPLDGAVLLSTIHVRADGSPAPPFQRRLWERVFRADALNEVPFAEVSTPEINAVTATARVDAAWLAANILDVPYAVGRRRLDTLLFAQRVLGDERADEATAATALRGYESYPALMLSLERAGIADAAVCVAAARHAQRLGAIADVPRRRTAIAAFQAAAALVVRARLTGVLDVPRAQTLIHSLAALEVTPRDGYAGRFAAWFRDVFVRALPGTDSGTVDDRVLSAVAGVAPAAPVRVTWEDLTYTLDPAGAELRRLRDVRERQRARALDAALTGDEALADALVALVYAAHLGAPTSTAAMAASVWARHDFGLTAASSAAAWMLPVEVFDKRAGWHVRGSLLGLETALGDLALRRVNATEMPAEPTVAPQDRQALALTAALMNPRATDDGSRDGIVAAIRRGRARAEALTAATLADVARDAALSEWRREALAWDLTHGATDAASRFSLLELLWLGSAGSPLPAAWDAWGAAALRRTGCLCLEMPRPRAWEEDAGYAVSLLGTRGADAALRTAELLADFRLPAAVAPALVGYTMQDVLEHARLPRPDDWEAFGRAARDLPRERVADEVAALAAGGPLVPVTKNENDRHIP